MLTLSATSSLGPTAVPPSILAVPQIDGSSLESSLDTPVVSDSNPIPDVSVVLTTEPLTFNANLKGWKNVLNMANTLVGKFFSLRPMVEMVRKWVKDKWKLKGSVSVSAMSGTLFLFKFTTEEDVALVLSRCWSYGRNNLSLYHWKVGFEPMADLQKTASVWVRLSRLPLEY
ncbi:hypothetical protein SUGI_1167520 [Cryptomeria japonica]|nr:hypothetical protein SUGI_1167520 [Cryptomeria japonica]